MSLLLQIVLGVVVVAVGACLVPLLLQMRRTAASVQALAESARLDINEIAKDVHDMKARVDHLAELAAATMAFPATINSLLATTVKGVSDLLGRPGSGWVELAGVAIRLVAGVFMRPKEKPHE